MAKKITETFEDLFSTKLDNVMVDILGYENDRTKVSDTKVDVCEDLFDLVDQIRTKYETTFTEAYVMANNHFDFVQKILARDDKGFLILFDGKDTENMPYDFKDTRKKYNEIREQKLQNDLPKLFKQALKRLTKLLSFEKLEAFQEYLGEYIKDTKLEMEQQKQLKENKAS